jgi:uncharacterized protein (UPF0147 family)
MEVEKICMLLSTLLEDLSIPKNVRFAVQKAKEKLESSGEESVKVSAAIYLLDEISNDINLPMHGRTMIWNVLSELEASKN